jgi:hypothetical protein
MMQRGANVAKGQNAEMNNPETEGKATNPNRRDTLNRLRNRRRPNRGGRGPRGDTVQNSSVSNTDDIKKRLYAN